MPDRFSKPLRWWAGLLLAVLAGAMLPSGGFARGSGGYSRPSYSARTPSFSGGGGAYRTPSTSGGYSRPAQSYARPPALSAPQSAGDRSFSQSRSSAALDSYRTQQQRPAPILPPQQSYSPPAQYRAPTTANRAGWFGDRGWSAPSRSYYGGDRSFGVWDGLFLWSLLSNLNRSGSSDFFHNNQNDPGYVQWRAEADRQAQDNADLRQKLAALDQQLAVRDSQPRTPGALPADVPADIAKAPPARTPGVPEEGGSSWVWVVLAVGAGGLVLLAWQRRRHSTGGSPMTPANPLQSATAMVRHKLSGEAYAPSRFRVGMTLALDPAPFILAAGRIKLTQPEGSGQISVSAVGRVVSGNTQLVRLYLPGERDLVQLHRDAAGDPDECRLFGIIDEVTPADPGEWGAWLDPNEGMIGWPEFQTKDGKTYARLWAPGDARVSPRVLDESIETLAGTRTVQSQAMLYGAPTGAPDPAPATEYIMVAARQDGGRAWVAIHAGIDINPITLQLA